MAWIDTLFRMMDEKRISDLHLASERVPMIRDTGELLPMEGLPKLSRAQIQQIVTEILPERNRQQFEEANDTDFVYGLEGVGRFRINLFVDRIGPGAVIRRIPGQIPTPEQLGLPPDILRMCEYRKGLVLIAGPAGAGKTTTLASLIDHINANRKAHIITIEDPVEYLHADKQSLVNQREVILHTRDVATALRAALREDPDVVQLGDLHQAEITRFALEAAEAGRLVFGILHTSTVINTIDRLISQFPSHEQEQVRMMLVGILRGVVTQSLVKRKDGGWVAAHEILFVTPAVAATIREGKINQITSQMQTGAKYGMQMLNDALEKLVKAGVVEAAEAYERAIEKEDMAKRLRVLGFEMEHAGGKAAAPGAAQAAGAQPGAAAAPAAQPGTEATVRPAPPHSSGSTWKRPGT
jgi:twitching motility protein PilT